MSLVSFLLKTIEEMRVASATFGKINRVADKAEVKKSWFSPSFSTKTLTFS